jgi:membrane protease YdiL (CAAX protease family)
MRGLLRRPYSPWIDCALWLLTGWLAALTTSVSVMVLERAVSLGGWLRSLLNVAPNVAGTGLVVILGLASSRARPSTVLSLRKPPWRVLPWVVLSSFCLALLAAGLNTWIDRILPMPASVEALFEQVLEYHTVTQFLGVIFFLVVVAPVTEELMFRGLFLHRIGESYGQKAAILGSALCFGIFHILPWQAVGAALIGIYLGWLVIRTGSIAMPMAAHAFFNLIPVAATGLSEHLPAAKGLGAGPDEFHLTPGLLAGASLALAAGILGTLRATRNGISSMPGSGGVAEGPPPEPSTPT